MPNSSKNSQPGFTSWARKHGLIKHGPGIYSSKQLRHVISPVNTAQEKKSKSICPSTFSKKSLMKHRNMDPDHFPSTCSENHSFILTSFRLSNTRKKVILKILSSLHQMEPYLTDMLMELLAAGLTNSSGVGAQKPSSPKRRRKG